MSIVFINNNKNISMKMKTLLLASATAIFALSYSSCKKSSDTNTTDTTSATVQATSDQSTTDNLGDDGNNAMNENVSQATLGSVTKGIGITPDPPTCASVTVDTTEIGRAHV